ncbi:uncharacterized protein ACN63O_009645 [Diretmus argenteus]
MGKDAYIRTAGSVCIVASVARTIHSTVAETWDPPCICLCRGVESGAQRIKAGAVCPAFVLGRPQCLPCRECLCWRGWQGGWVEWAAGQSRSNQLGVLPLMGAWSSRGWCRFAGRQETGERKGFDRLLGVTATHAPLVLTGGLGVFVKASHTPPSDRHGFHFLRVKGHEVSGPVKGQVLLWVVVSLLPLVEGARMGTGSGIVGVGPDSGHAVGLLGGQEERQLPVTLPEVVEDEEQEDESDPYSTWHALYDPYVTDEADDHPSSHWVGRFPRSSDPSEPQPKGSPKKKKKRKKKEKEGEKERGDRTGKGKNSRQSKKSSRDCRVEKREMRVRDLGLGFDSDEIVLFKFCVGSCQSSRANYDLALKALLENGSLPRRTARKVSSHPCCRPDRYEPVSFMDAQTRWMTIQSLSAASCMCMG